MHDKIIQIVDKIQEWRKAREVARKNRELRVSSMVHFNRPTYRPRNREWSRQGGKRTVDNSALYS